MTGFKKFVVSLLIVLFVLPLNLISVKAEEIQPSTSIAPITSTELVDQRTQFTKTFQKSDGKKELVAYQEPINYKAEENGKTVWKEIDSNVRSSTVLQSDSISSASTSPAPTSSMPVYTNTANDFSTSFSSNITQGGASLAKNGAAVSLIPKSTVVNGMLPNPYNSFSSYSNYIYPTMPSYYPYTYPFAPYPSSSTMLPSMPYPYSYAFGSSYGYHPYYSYAPYSFPYSFYNTTPTNVNLTSAQPVIEGNKLTYKNIAADTDLIYYSVNDGMKEDIVLRRYYGQNTFKFDLNISNAHFERIPDGSYKFYDNATNELVFYLPKLYMWDSRGGKGSLENQYSYNISSSMLPKATGGYELSITADHNWLSNPARVFPITIDPSLNTGVPYGLDTYVQEGYPTYNMWSNRDMYVGRGSTKLRTRAFIPFQIDLSNKRISDATVSVYQISCYSACQNNNVTVYTSGNYDPQGVTWNNQPGAINWITSGNNSGINTWLNFNVTDALKHWFEAKNPTGSRVGSFEFVQDNEGFYGYRQWVAENHPDGVYADKKPKLSVSYVDYNAEYSFSGVHDAKIFDNYAATLNIRNTGSDSVWSPRNTSVNIGIKNNKTGENWALNYPVPYDMGYGAGASIPFSFGIGDSPGNYTFYADIYRNDFTCSGGGGCYLSDLGVGEGQASFNVANYPDYAAEINPQYPTSYSAGSSYPVTVTLKNNSRTYWSAQSFSLGYRLIDKESGLEISRGNTPLANDVSQVWTGNSSYLTMQIDIKTPLKIGQYTFKWDILQAGVGWLSDKGVTFPIKDISISAPSFSAISHFGSEDYYAMVGPVDMGSGGLIYSVGDVSLPTITGGINAGRNYNSNLSTTNFSSDANGFITKWLVNGPYYENDSAMRFDKSYLNESTLKPSAGLVTNNRIWFEANVEAGQNSIDFNSAYKNFASITNNDNLSTYASVYVYSPTDQALKLKIGSDDGIKLWLNGTLVHSNKVDRGVIADNDSLNVSLTPGWNRLISKISQGTGGHGLAARFTDVAGIPITNLKFAINNPDVIQNETVFGKNWSPNFAEKLDLSDGNNVYYLDGSNSLNIYTKNSDGSYQKPSGSGLDLSKNADNTYSMVDKYGTKYNYRTDGRISNRVDALGNMINYQYDSFGKCVKIYDKTADGKGTRFISINYASGLVSNISDHLGTVLVSYSYANGYLTRVTDQLGNSVNYTYDAGGRMTQNIDKKGQKIIIGYAAGRVFSLQDELGNMTKFAYLPNKVEVTDPMNRKSTIWYDTVSKMMTKFTDPSGYSESYEHDAGYNITRVYPLIPENDGLFYSFDYVYDSNSNLISSSDPLGNKTLIEYQNNYPTEQTDPSGNITSSVYNAKGQITSSTDSKSNKTSYAYDDYGHLLTTTDPKGNVSSNLYSDEGDLISTTSAKNETTLFTFDSTGRKLTQKSALGKVTQFSYDVAGRMATITDAAGLSTKVEYDANGNIIRQINPKGFYKTYAYDASNRLISITDEIGAVISYQYDKVGNQTKTIDANGKAVTYEYDSLNQLTKVTDSRGKASTIVYDKNGNITNTNDFNGNQYAQKSDKAGNPIEITAPDGSFTLKYDKNGNISEATTPNQKTAITYDSNNNTTSVNSLAGSVSAQYDNNNNVTKVSTANTSVDLSYDQNNKISQISQTINTTGQTLISKINLDAEGKLSSILKANGDIALYSYDLAGRITSITNRNSSKAMLSRYNYQFDNASNITAISEDRTRALSTYNYDGRNQLINENAVSYSYDPMGNRTKMVNAAETVNYSYDAVDSNLLLSANSTLSGNTSYEYDSNGNVVKKTNPAGITTYVYDTDGYFTNAVLSNGTKVEYTYDKISKLRTSRTVTNLDGTTSIINFTWDSDRLISETDNSGKVLKAYAWDENERLVSVSIPDETGTLKTFYYVKNAKGDITSLTDQNGIRVVDYEYDAWGNIKKSVTLASSPISNLDKINTRLYGGYWYDATLGSYFMKVRLYDSGIGRFLSRDPLQSGIDPIDQNPYVYCGNNPISRIDPSGKFWHIVIGAVAGAIIGGAIDAVVQYKTSGSINWKEVGAAAVGGAVAGAIFAATAGAGTSLLGMIGAGAIAGAAGGTASYTVSNWGHLSLKGAAKVAGAGAIAGVIGGAIGYGAGKALAKAVSIATTSRIVTSFEESATGPVVSKAVSAPLRNAPAPMKLYELTGDRAEHVVIDHGYGTLTKGKTTFPESWDPYKMKGAIETIANNKSIAATGNTYGRPGFIRIGEYDGITIKTVIRPDKTTGFLRIWTGYPLN